MAMVDDYNSSIVNIRNLATELFASGDIDSAAQVFNCILEKNSGDTHAIFYISLILREKKNYFEALSYLRLGVLLAPTSPTMRFLEATVLRALDLSEDAIKSFDKAIELKPDYIEALIESGKLAKEQRKYKDALMRFSSALRYDSEDQYVLSQCANLLGELNMIEAAIMALEKLLQLNPDHSSARGRLLYYRMKICEWTDFVEISNDVIAEVQAGKPFSLELCLMLFSASAGDHFKNAKNNSSQNNLSRLWSGKHYKHRRIRVAYVSPDFREHPVGYLMSGVLKRHDSKMFEIFAISLIDSESNRIREQIEGSIEHFIDVSGWKSKNIAAAIRDLEIDILVDLAGKTSDSQPDIFHYRPAPVQITYLGYPGTMGSEDFDYILADRYIIPEESQKFYSEKVIYLPNTYLPPAADVKASDEVITREQCGLPETGIIFCSFNREFKINPALYSCWMRILLNVPDSVLWLTSNTNSSMANLQRAAEGHGINPARLVFAKRVPLVEDHLARYRLADLFLDTFPYNGHTTTADAIMLGLPVITCSGEAFPSRVAGSLLHTLGVPELITESLTEYEALAIKLASNSELLTHLKRKISQRTKNTSLLDLDLFCKNLESTLTELSMNIHT